MNEVITRLCVNAYTFLLPVAWICIAIVVVILLPLAIFRATRSFAGTGIFFSSYIFGLTTWFLGAAVTFITWGWLGLLIGLVFFGVGVVPIGILAAFISLQMPSVGFSLIVMTGIVLAARVGGLALAESKRTG